MWSVCNCPLIYHHPRSLSSLFMRLLAVFHRLQQSICNHSSRMLGGNLKLYNVSRALGVDEFMADAHCTLHK